jgi:hypothetical protein
MHAAASYVLPHTVQEPRFVRVTESGVSRHHMSRKRKLERVLCQPIILLYVTCGGQLSASLSYVIVRRLSGTLPVGTIL